MLDGEPNSDWWRGAVIYQVYPRSFLDTDGDGIGDLPGLTRQVPYIASLGVDAVWLCPVFVSPQRDFGYDIADHTAIDPRFGTLEDFDILVARLHAHGLRLLIDLVWAHTSDAHPWFRDSRAGREGPLSDWYVWADPRPDGTPPNNWLSVFGGSAWTWEPRRRQYYLHHFLPSQPSLNLRNPAVVEAQAAVARFWLDRGVDGFRLDAMDFLQHDPALRDNPAAARPEGAPLPAKLFGMQEHVHDMMHPDGAAVMQAVRRLVDAYPGACTLGEFSSQPGAFARVAAATAGSDLLHMGYTLGPLRGGYDWTSVRALLEEVARHADDGWYCWSFSNHDVERAASRWGPYAERAGHHPAGPEGPARARQLLALLMTLRGSVSLYQGEELGLPEADLGFEDLHDPFGIAYWPEFRGRDGSRTPMPWRAAAPHAGFSTIAPPGRPWLPVPAAHAALAVDVQESHQGSMLDYTRALLRWRRREPCLRYGSFRVLDLPAPVIGFERAHDGQALIALFNLSGETVPVRAPALLERLPPSMSAGGAVVLPPHGSVFGMALWADAAPAGVAQAVQSGSLMRAAEGSA